MEEVLRDSKALLLAALMVVLVGFSPRALSQDAPPPKPKQASAPRKEGLLTPQAPSERAFLLIDADVSCTVGVERGEQGACPGWEGPEALKVSVELGQNVVEAASDEAGAVWKQVTEVKATGQSMLTVSLAESLAINRGDWVDTSTGLMWTATDVAVETWNDVDTFCQAYGAGGHRDWRLPAIEDISSIRSF